VDNWPKITSAVSMDGRSLDYEAGEGTAVMIGDVISLAVPGDRTLLVQIRSKERGPGRRVRGTGTVVGALAEGRLTPISPEPFSSAAFAEIGEEAIDSIASSESGPVLALGSALGRGFPGLVRAEGFNRHTFLCGQSGSGKTYALGVILERLLMETDLRLIVLDPNADFVNLPTLRPEASSDIAERLAAAQRDVRVFRATRGGDPLRLPFGELSAQAQAGLLRLDPIENREEFNVLLHFETSGTPSSGQALLERLHAAGPEARGLALRIENLGVLDWAIWARGGPSVLDALRRRPRAAVLDLGGFETSVERSLAAVAVLDDLWARREEREPCLLVIDEAHNICPAEPTEPLQALAAERLVQIAGEGRKFGLWLLLASQRPSKIHPQVLSQCDNLVLMRMNSPGDLDELARVFGFAPPSMLRAAPSFAKGEALLAGMFAIVPTVTRIGGRLTPEGGSDLEVPLS
jgi:uncharacterized protein